MADKKKAANFFIDLLILAFQFMLFKLNPQKLLAILFAFVNILAFFYIESSDLLIGDFQGYFVNSQILLIVSLALVLSSIVVLFLTYNQLNKIRFTNASTHVDNRLVDLFVLILVLFFIIYVHTTGLFIASSAERGGTLLSMFWVVCNIDLIFSVYYINCRNNKLFFLVLAFWAISSIQRGWFSFLFVVVSLEFIRYVRRKSQLGFTPFILIFLILLLYPVFDLIKVNVRELGYFDFSTASDIFASITQDASFSWFDTIYLAIEKIVGRIQTVSHVYAILENLINSSGSDFLPIFFLKEGVLGIAFDKFLGYDHGFDAAQALANFISPDSSLSWNVNPSLIGWVLMHFQWMPLVILYVFILCALSVYFQKKLQSSEQSSDFLWFFWLGLLLPGWIAQFVSFVIAQFIFLHVARFLCFDTKSSFRNQEF